MPMHKSRLLHIHRVFYGSNTNITVEELMRGKQLILPGLANNETFKKAKRNEDKAVSRGLF